MVKFRNEDCEENYNRNPGWPSGKGSRSEWNGDHPDGENWTTTRCGVERIRQVAAAPGQSEILAHLGRVEGRPLISADTSTWVSFLGGESGWDVELLDRALKDRQVVMVPPVLTELLSDPNLTRDLEEQLCDVPLVQIGEGYWRRAGKSRAALLAKGTKARLGDALIAQCCIDSGVSLVTRDRDFQAFAKVTKLNLATENS